jgi:hypothetical protein
MPRLTHPVLIMTLYAYREQRFQGWVEQQAAGLLSDQVATPETLLAHGYADSLYYNSAESWGYAL